MRKISKIITSLVLSIVLLGGSAVYASSPSKGMKGSNNEILSSVTTYAGTGDLNLVNGEKLSAAFHKPQAIVTLPDGTILVSDSGNHVIRQIKDGEVSTYAGFTLELNEMGYPQGGWHDDVKETAVFNTPMGMDVDAEGNIYIADAENYRIRKIDTDGNVTTVAGSGALGSLDGIGVEAEFYRPEDVAVAEDGTLYVADTLNHLIRKITLEGEVTTLNALSDRTVEYLPGAVDFAGDYQDGALKDAKFNEPANIEIDSKGNLYISDRGNNLIRYVDLAAETVSTVAGYRQSGDSIYVETELYAASGFMDGAALEAVFYTPTGIALTEEDGLLIADSMNNTIRYLMDGQVITLAGNLKAEVGNNDGINGYNAFQRPTDIAVLDGSILIVDSYNNLLREYSLYNLPNSLPVNDEVKVVLNDEVITFDAKPELINGRTMVPVRALTEQMGYVVEFDPAGQEVYLTKDDIRIELFIGESIITSQQTGSDKAEKEIDIAPYIKEDRTYAPLRFFSEELGLDVQWSQKHKTVILRDI